MFDRLIFDSGKFDRETNNSYEGRMHGRGELVCSPEMIQYLNITLDGSASFVMVFGIVIYITGNSGEIIEGNPPGQGGTGGMELVLIMETDVDLSGAGDLDIFNFGDIVTDVLKLSGITLLPGETITIDSDSMTVLFGLVHDVSSLTSDSVFFYLNEGENELKFIIGYQNPPSPIPENELETTIIWQNRWL